MGKEILTSQDVEFEKNKFYRHKTPIFLKKRDQKVREISFKISFDEENYKYFIGYLNNDHKVKNYVKTCGGQTKRMCILFEDDDFSEKNSTIWNKINADIEEEFSSEPVYNKIIFEIKTSWQ